MPLFGPEKYKFNAKWEVVILFRFLIFLHVNIEADHDISDEYSLLVTAIVWECGISCYLRVPPDSVLSSLNTERFSRDFDNVSWW